MREPGRRITAAAITGPPSGAIPTSSQPPTSAAGARSYLCNADPGVFGGVATREICGYQPM